MNQRQAYPGSKLTTRDLLTRLTKKSRELQEKMKEIDRALADLSSRQDSAPTEIAGWIVRQVEDDGSRTERAGKIRDYVLFLLGLLISAGLAAILHSCKLA